MDKKIEFWGLEDDEQLIHTEMDDAIESILDGVDAVDALPKTIEVCGFIHSEPNAKSEAAKILAQLLENLDKDYGDPGGAFTKATDGMKRAAKVFVITVLEEYTVWACELVKRETINVREWIKENRPDWLEEDDKKGN